jgi:separase
MTALFETTPALKQLASIVDRVTYMAACELLLGPGEVSLSRDSVWADVERPEGAVLGALLERQIGSLEASRWKPHVKVLVARLLLDANDIYLADVHPVRRARILLRWLEFKYHGGIDEEGEGYLGPMAEMVEEVERLLSHDVSLVFLCPRVIA